MSNKTIKVKEEQVIDIKHEIKQETEIPIIFSVQQQHVPPPPPPQKYIPQEVVLPSSVLNNNPLVLAALAESRRRLAEQRPSFNNKAKKKKKKKIMKRRRSFSVDEMPSSNHSSSSSSLTSNQPPPPKRFKHSSSSSTSLSLNTTTHSTSTSNPSTRNSSTSNPSTSVLTWIPIKSFPRWNTTDIFDGFLFLGAGKDDNGRSLPYHKGESDALWSEKNTFFAVHNIRYVLNMASVATELKDSSYSVQKGAIKYLGLPMNDTEEFTNEMGIMFDQGAAFIEECCRLHLSMKSRQDAQPMSIYVHCVAGVHRSAMVVVWWMVKYHSWNLRHAWGTVRNIRDKSCNWRNVTLGGSPEDKKSNWFIGCWKNLSEQASNDKIDTGVPRTHTNSSARAFRPSNNVRSGTRSHVSL